MKPSTKFTTYTVCNQDVHYLSREEAEIAAEDLDPTTHEVAEHNHEISVCVSSAEDADDERDPEALYYYVGVTIVLDGIRYRVGTMVGAPESDHGSIRAAGCGVRPYCTAWQVDASDLESVPIWARDAVRSAMVDRSLAIYNQVAG